MFGLDDKTFDSNKATFEACYRMLCIALAILALSVVVSFVIGLKKDTLYVLMQPSVLKMYLSGFLTMGSLCWACRWSARREDD